MEKTASLRTINGIKLTREEFLSCCKIQKAITDKGFVNIDKNSKPLIDYTEDCIRNEFGFVKMEKLTKNPNFNKNQLNGLDCYAFRFKKKRPLLLLFISNDGAYSFIDESRIEAFGEKGLFLKATI